MSKHPRGHAKSGADYLFVDEAGQVTLELLAVLAQRAENLVLAAALARTRGPMASQVGDQQQLPPPVQQRVLLTQSGGSSCLDYFTQGAARVDGRCGIFLATTYRMSAQLTEASIGRLRGWAGASGGERELLRPAAAAGTALRWQPRVPGAGAGHPRGGRGVPGGAARREPAELRGGA